MHHDMSNFPLHRDATVCPLAKALDEPTKTAADEHFQTGLQEKASVKIMLEPLERSETCAFKT